MSYLEALHREHRGVRGGGARPPLGGCNAPDFFFYLRKCDTYLGKRVMYLGGFFGTWFLPMVFYFWLRN